MNSKIKAVGKMSNTEDKFYFIMREAKSDFTDERDQNDLESILLLSLVIFEKNVPTMSVYYCTAAIVCKRCRFEMNVKSEKVFGNDCKSEEKKKVYFASVGRLTAASASSKITSEKIRRSHYHRHHYHRRNNNCFCYFAPLLFIVVPVLRDIL
uniref:Uncharacterized protein n=1 Tax=Glossina palpalis gambiensis TaxID=67801 RepID=A0A1B0AWJ4_9MUSC